MFLFFCQLNINQLYLLFFEGQIYVKSVKYPTDSSENANLKLGIKQLGENCRN